jgi:hypothetical protein
VAEWSKALAWKVSIRQKRIEGSNPSRSAILPFTGVRRRPKNPNKTLKYDRKLTHTFTPVRARPKTGVGLSVGLRRPQGVQNRLLC